MKQYKLVPLNLTSEMRTAFHGSYEGIGSCPDRQWSAMLKAAPKAKQKLVVRLDEIINDLLSGFVACRRCGHQEDTATLDCLAELKSIRADLAET